MGDIVEEDECIIKGVYVMDKNKDINISANFLKDVSQEDAFKEALGHKKPANLPTELDKMTMVYEEQLEKLIRVRFDVEIFRRLESMEPTNAEWKESRIRSDQIILHRRKTVETIRKHIIEYVNARKTRG